MFDGIEPEGAEEWGEHIVENCGKLKFLDRLLKKIYEKKEQVLINHIQEVHLLQTLH